MKIYKYTANNGDWNGFHTHFIVAESKEEIENTDLYKTYMSKGFEVTKPKEITNKDILLALGLYSFYDKINFSYSIIEEV